MNRLQFFRNSIGAAIATMIGLKAKAAVPLPIVQDVVASTKVFGMDLALPEAEVTSWTLYVPSGLFKKFDILEIGGDRRQYYMQNDSIAIPMIGDGPTYRVIETPLLKDGTILKMPNENTTFHYPSVQRIYSAIPENYG